MVLAMARPLRHPVTGIYWFRKAVPDDLRQVLGKREIKFSLRTRDKPEATRRHALKHAEVLKEWSALRGGGGTKGQTVGDHELTLRDCEVLAGCFYRAYLEKEVLDKAAFVPLGCNLIFGALNNCQQPTKNGPILMEHKFGSDVDRLLAERGLIVDPESRRWLLDAIFRASCQAHKQINKECEGD